MFKKKRLAMMGAMIAAVLGAIYYAWWVAPLLLGCLAGLLAGLKWLRYGLAHSGLEQLRDRCARYHVARQVEALNARRAPERVRFVVLGDNRNTSRIPPVIHECAKQEGPAFIFNTGDLVRFGRASEYVRRYVPLLEIAEPVPVFSVPGNHDRGARHDFAGFVAVHGDERFTFDYGCCRFVGINNAKKGRVEKGDIAFLQGELAKPGAEHKFVFIHIPPRFFEDGIITTTKRRGFKKLAGEFHDLMVRHHVTEVFMGHIHGYSSKLVDGVQYTLTAGAGAPLCKQLPEQSRVHNYVVVEAGAGGLTREVVRLIDGVWTRGA